MIQMYFGKACKEYREEMNISQEKFALSIGMDRTYYSSVEAGKRNVLHAVFQHKLLCEKVAEYDDLESFCSKYSNDLNDGILKVYKQL